MARTIGPKAPRLHIVDHVLRTWRAGRAAGGELVKVFDARLNAPIANVQAAQAAEKTATEAAASARAAVTAADRRSKRGIRLFRDTVWNVLGRPARSIQMNQLFPAGMGTYLPRAPEKQPNQLRLLCSRLDDADPALVPDEVKKEWKEKLEALGVAEEAALTAYAPLQAAALVAASDSKATVAAAQLALVALKRDLKNLGLAEAQIHQYIPDASPETRTAGKPGAGGGTPGNGGAPPPVNGNGSAVA